MIEAKQIERYLEDHLSKAGIGKAFYCLKERRFFCDAVCKALHGYQGDDTISLLSFLRFYRKDETMSKVKALISSLNSQADANFDSTLQVIQSNGTLKWVRCVGKSVCTKSDCEGLSIIFMDADLQMNQVNTLSKKLSIMEESFLHATEGIAFVTLGGKFIRANPAIEQMLGFTEESLQQKNVLDFVKPSDLPEFESVLIKFLKGEIVRYLGEKEYVSASGEKKWISLWISMVRDEHQNPDHFVYIINDITENLNSKQKLENLASLVNNQNQRLLDFAYIVSHNLRSHTGNLSMILDLLKIENPLHTQNNYFPYLEKTTLNLERTINDLNNVIDLYSYRQEDIQKVSLDKTITQIVTNYAEVIDSTNVAIHQLVPEVYVDFIPAYLENVIKVLLDNAIKYRDKEKSAYVKFSYSERQESHVLEVEDNGLGFDRNRYGEKVFGMYKKFHHVDNSRGFNLFLIKNQIEALRGSIDVESIPGKGTKFTIYFSKLF